MYGNGGRERVVYPAWSYGKIMNMLDAVLEKGEAVDRGICPGHLSVYEIRRLRTNLAGYAYCRKDQMNSPDAAMDIMVSLFPREWAQLEYLIGWASAGGLQDDAWRKKPDEPHWMAVVKACREYWNGKGDGGVRQ